MPLIVFNKPEKEKKYIFSNYEQLALDVLPPEQIRSTNHDPALIDLMLDEEIRDASPEHTLSCIYKALRNGYTETVLAASKNLTVAERNKIVQGIYHKLLGEATPSEAAINRVTDEVIKKAPEFAPAKDVEKDIKKALERLDMSPKSAERLALLFKNPHIDLFDLCVKLSK